MRVERRGQISGKGYTAPTAARGTKPGGIITASDASRNKRVRLESQESKKRTKMSDRTEMDSVEMAGNNGVGRAAGKD